MILAKYLRDAYFYGCFRQKPKTLFTGDSSAGQSRGFSYEIL